MMKLCLSIRRCLSLCPGTNKIITVNVLKIRTIKRLTKRHANSADPDQTAPEGAV